MKPKFKIGDKVKIANDSFGGECGGLGVWYLDDTGTITNIYEEEHVTVRLDKDNTEHGCFYIGQLELVSSEESKPEQPRFKVGDRVRVLDTENIKRWRVMWGHVGSPVGHVATITFVSEEGNKFLLDGNKWGTNFLASDLEAVADERTEVSESSTVMTFEEAKPYLKPGMRVRCVTKYTKFGNGDTRSEFQDGIEATIEAKDIKPNYVTLGSIGCGGRNDKLQILTEADGITPWKKPTLKRKLFNPETWGDRDVRFSTLPPQFDEHWPVEPVDELIGLARYAAMGYLERKPERKSLMSKAVEFVKNKALQVSNPDEYELRKAGLHDEDGDLTEDGIELQNEFLRELVKKQMVESAKAINAEKKEKCA